MSHSHVTDEIFFTTEAGDIPFLSNDWKRKMPRYKNGAYVEQRYGVGDSIGSCR